MQRKLSELNYYYYYYYYVICFCVSEFSVAVVTLRTRKLQRPKQHRLVRLRILSPIRGVYRFVLSVDGVVGRRASAFCRFNFGNQIKPDTKSS